MRRPDRLFQIVQLIRGRRLTTAQWLAQQWLDPALARASESALSRVMSVLSAAQRQQAQNLVVYATPFGLLLLG